MRKKLSHISWYSRTLIKIPKAFIFSNLDYGASLFSTAKLPHLKILEPIHNTGIRLSIGAFRSSPVQSILTLAGILFLIRRWEERTSKVAARMSRLSHDITPHSKYTFSNIYKKYDLENLIPAETL